MNLGIFLSIGDSLSEMKKSGQADRFINLYLKNYVKNFNNVYLFSYQNENWKLPKGVTLISKNSRLHRYPYAFFLPWIHRKILKKCDVVRGFGLTSSISSMFLTKPFVFNWAYDYLEFAKIEKKYAYMPFYMLLEKIAFVKASKVFIATKAKLKSLKSNKKFIYLPNGVDLKLFKAPSETSNGLIYVGRFEQQKNLFFLLDTLSFLLAKQRNITFVGSGSQEEALMSYAAKREIKLKIIAPQKHSDLPGILKKYSIFALPSLAEGSSKILLETMALGLVPVVNDFKTAKDVIYEGENGFIVNYDVKEFARKIKNILKNYSLRAKLSKKAKETIKENFDQGKLIKKEISILKNV